MFHNIYFVISMTEATTYEVINHFLKRPFLPLNARSPFNIAMFYIQLSTVQRYNLIVYLYFTISFEVLYSGFI